MTKKKIKQVPMASSPEYMRQYRLRQNQDARSRVGIKVKNYLTDKQVAEIEKAIDNMIGWKQG